MPKYVNFTHPKTGQLITNAYCELNVVEINKRLLTAHVRFDIYATKDTFDAGKNLIHDSDFNVTGQEFIDAMTAESLHQKSVKEICYEHAETKLRVDPRDPASPLLFATATDQPV